MNFKEDQFRYKVYWEEDNPKKDQEAWRNMEIRGKRGIIYPYSETHLVAFVKPGLTGSRLQGNRKFQILRETDDGREFIAKNEALMTLCNVIGAFKRRQVSPEAVNAFKLRIRPYLFRKKQ